MMRNIPDIDKTIYNIYDAPSVIQIQILCMFFSTEVLLFFRLFALINEGILNFIFILSLLVCFFVIKFLSWGIHTRARLLTLTNTLSFNMTAMILVHHSVPSCSKSG